MAGFLLGMLVMYVLMGLLALVLFTLSSKVEVDAELLFSIFHHPWIWFTVIPLCNLIEAIVDLVGGIDENSN